MGNEKSQFDRRVKDMKDKLIIGVLTTIFTVMLSGLGFLIWQGLSFSTSYVKDMETLDRRNEYQDQTILSMRKSIDQEFIYVWRDMAANVSEIKKIKDDSTELKINLGKMQINIINIKDGVDDIKETLKYNQK